MSITTFFPPKNILGHVYYACLANNACQCGPRRIGAWQFGRGYLPPSCANPAALSVPSWASEAAPISA